MTWLLPGPVLIPFLAAGAAMMLGRHHRTQASLCVGALSTSLVVAIVLAVQAASGPVALDVGSWAAPLGVTLVVDQLSGIMLVMSLTITLLVLVYALAQASANDGDSDAPASVYHPVFHPAYLILSAGVSNAFLTGDLFNLYVGFEILLAASFVLMTMGGTAQRIRSGTVYVVVSLLGSLIFLIAIALVYGACGTISFAQLAIRLRTIDPGVAMVLQTMLLVAFGLKAAIFPLSAWLPDSYPTASAPITAVFAGLLTKVGIYAIIRTQVLLFPPSPADTVLGLAGIVTMIVGILGAIAQDDIKRLLSFTLVSHMGFMLWGIVLGNRIGLASAIFYAVHHILVQTTLFLVAGLIEQVGGSTSLRRLSSLASVSTGLVVLYLIPGLNLVGFPPLTGFLGKLGLAQASIRSGTSLGVALLVAGLVTSLLTLYVVIKVWNLAFWQGDDQPQADPRPAGGLTYHRGRAMAAPTAALVVIALGLSAGAGPVYGYVTRGAGQLLERTPYVRAVLGDLGRGSGESQHSGGADPEGSLDRPHDVGGDPDTRLDHPSDRTGENGGARDD
ncbi:Na+/H+ antiporter subunit D [Nanchangia anserum]|uniref:Na+/H+ antiporter subunit D n=1 Tax=Nanchangia anserum TaxID=2692125 RepID=A0A8I0KU36_9ACTO|nr:Na+/H+ antiporter subunit D [Nanchangia anserum]MBD3689273.1 Na+/H+ antiporter subunit D [Nanchangia anserum]